MVNKGVGELKRLSSVLLGSAVLVSGVFGVTSTDASDNNNEVKLISKDKENIGIAPAFY